MKSIKKLFATITMIVGLCGGNNAFAGIPVIDATSVAQQVQQVIAWGQQLQQMAAQLTQAQQIYAKAQQTLTSMSGIRNMAGLATNNNRQYLPSSYQNALTNGFGNSAAIRSAATVLDISSTNIDPASDTAQSFESNANQAALNRAMNEEAYTQASARFNSMQALLDKVNDAPDPKDMADLQGRIQAEQVMLQNENAKLAALTQLQQSQRDLAYQRSIEMRMKAAVSTRNYDF